MKKQDQNKVEFINGQLSIFDINVTEKPIKITETGEKVTENVVSVTEIINKITPTENEKTVDPLILTENQQQFLDKNKIMENENLSRIIIRPDNGLVIETKESDMFTSHYINSEGKEEFSYQNKATVLPWDKIIYYALELEEIPLAEVQENKLKRLLDEREDIKRVIRRKGDENILIEVPEGIINITPIGWELLFESINHIDCSEDEIYMVPEKVSHKSEEEDTVETQKKAKVGDYVQAIRGKDTIEGELYSEYNSGHTFNIIFENGTKHTAIPRVAILKILKSA